VLSEAVRIKFSKVGSLQFISHLDLNRTMKTVMIRAGIPIKYSEGFNPHPKMVFALPLSVGAESITELLDFKITRPMSKEELTERLNNAFPPEMRVLDAYQPDSKFVSIRYAEYELENDEDFSLEPLEQDEIVLLKRTKSGEKLTDIKPMIHSYKKEGNKLTCVLSASPDQYLNPDYIAKVLGINDCTILRKRVLLDDGVTEFR
jgi:radical SAM-linked protein